MNIKVIIDDGVIRGVLKDSDAPVHVELIDTSDSYKDSEIEKHALSFLNDPNYINCEYEVADFEEYVIR